MALYDVVLVRLCSPSASFGRFVPALVFRACFLLRRLFSCGRTSPAQFLMSSLFLVLDQIGSFLLRSVLTVLFAPAQVCMVCFFFNIHRLLFHIVAACSLVPSEFW